MSRKLKKEMDLSIVRMREKYLPKAWFSVNIMSWIRTITIYLLGIGIVLNVVWPKI